MRSLQNDLGLIYGMQIERIFAICENCGESYIDIYNNEFDDPYEFRIQHTKLRNKKCCNCGKDIFDFKIEYSILVGEETEE